MRALVKVPRPRHGSPQNPHRALRRRSQGRGRALDFRNAMSYSDYLGLKGLLASQTPLSGAHDEMLFIVIHQASEL